MTRQDFPTSAILMWCQRSRPYWIVRRNGYARVGIVEVGPLLLKTIAVTDRVLHDTILL